MQCEVDAHLDGDVTEPPHETQHHRKYEHLVQVNEEYVGHCCCSIIARTVSSTRSNVARSSREPARLAFLPKPPSKRAPAFCTSFAPFAVKASLVRRRLDGSSEAARSSLAARRDTMRLMPASVTPTNLASSACEDSCRLATPCSAK